MTFKTRNPILAIYICNIQSCSKYQQTASWERYILQSEKVIVNTSQGQPMKQLFRKKHKQEVVIRSIALLLF